MLKEIVKRKKYVPLSYDLMFKKIFEDGGSTKTLKRLLKVTLGINAKSIRILNNEILGESVHSKKTTVDLIAFLDDGTKISIEMNKTVSEEIIDRNIAFIFRIMGNSLKHGEDYKDLEKHIQINFDMEGYHRKPIDTFKIINTEDLNYVLTDKLTIIKIDVPYFVKRCYNLSNEKLTERDKLIGLIGIEDEEKALELADKDGFMKEIVNKIREYSQEDIMAMSYDRDFHVKQCAKIEAERILKKGMKKLNKQKKELKLQKANIEEQKANIEEQKANIEEQKANIEEQMANIEEQKEQLEIQMEQLRQDGIVKTAKNMLEKKCDINFISSVTGLTVEDINNIEV